MVPTYCSSSKFVANIKNRPSWLPSLKVDQVGSQPFIILDPTVRASWTSTFDYIRACLRSVYKWFKLLINKK